LDFLDAPARMADFFSSRLLRMLTVPYRSRLVNLATRPFYQVADRILGTQFLEDIAEFFILFQTMAPGFVERANAVSRLLGDRRTSFIVVTTLEAAPAREAEFFIDVLTSRRLHLGAIVLNKVLPAYLRDPGGAAARLAARLEHEAPAVAGSLADLVPDEGNARLGQVLTEVAENFIRFELVAQREAEQEAALGRVPDVVVTVPSFENDIVDLAGLLELGSRLCG
jgi:anion-transporting  ArsA/GET3 family ATPase